MQIEWLLTYASELNAIERDRRTRKRLYLANQSIFDLDALNLLIHRCIRRMNEHNASSRADVSKAAWLSRSSIDTHHGQSTRQPCLVSSRLDLVDFECVCVHVVGQSDGASDPRTATSRP